MEDIREWLESITLGWGELGELGVDDILGLIVGILIVLTIALGIVAVIAGLMLGGARGEGRTERHQRGRSLLKDGGVMILGGAVAIPALLLLLEVVERLTPA